MKKILLSLVFVFIAIVIASCNTSTTEDTGTDLTTTEMTTTENPTTTHQPTVVTTIDRPSTTEIETTTEAPTTLTPTTTEQPTTVITTESPELINVSIEIVDRFYEIGDTFDATSVVLTGTYNNDETIVISNDLISLRSFKTDTPGYKTAFIIYDSFLIEYEYIVLEDYAFEINNLYYEDAINLRGEVLKVALNTIISEGFIDLLYGDAIWVLEESDVDPNNPDNVILVYPGQYGASVPTGYSSAISGYYWNREHVWPQSRLGVNVSYTNDFPSKATDVHNLKPADPDENSRRSNDYFDNIVTNDTFEPNDEVKGDIARIIFYMATRYFDLTLNDDPTSSSGLKTMGTLSVLLEWNQQDPVDEFEMNRNNVIHQHQGNRNPFIDYPEFAELIWGELAE